MNKQDLINYVSADTGLSKADAKRAVESVFDNIKTALSKADTAQFIGFGTFKVEHREAREGRKRAKRSKLRRRTWLSSRLAKNWPTLCSPFYQRI